MQLSFCDKCGRPLSEGSVVRGEAVQRDGDLVCNQCVAREQAAVKAAAPPAPGVPKPLVEYAQAVWACDGCGIPITALDLIEGRAVRHGAAVRCARCSPVPAQPVTAAPVPAAAPPVSPPAPQARPAAPEPAPSGRRMPPARRPAAARPAVDDFVQQARKDERRPVLPIVLFAIVLPMFAVSLYFAVTSQQKLNEAMAGRGNDERADRRAERPFERLEPDTAAPRNQPRPDTRVEPAPEPVPAIPAPPPAPTPAMTPEVARELATIEQQLAQPVILQLQSKSLADVWEGLIAAGSRRLIAARPHVRALLREPDDNTRALACRVCGILADREALPALEGMIQNDPAESVRIEARKAKGRLTGSATREVKDMTDSELEEYLRALQRELERRRGKHD
ncbi:MAG: HEAT repeat domain-containing protein [Planctomycetes bacterium]|jgi:hypothetical protein|nr:HEAT repeat domain-containing protein [Planctomycetota bacterium]MCL4728914.1 HEAT repeat domain-containing protein [Planctomycetota bacterium]